MSTTRGLRLGSTRPKMCLTRGVTLVCIEYDNALRKSINDRQDSETQQVNGAPTSDGIAQIILNQSLIILEGGKL